MITEKYYVCRSTFQSPADDFIQDGILNVHNGREKLAPTCGFDVTQVLIYAGKRSKIVSLVLF
jgi:hypothetical protein